MATRWVPTQQLGGPCRGVLLPRRDEGGTMRSSARQALAADVLNKWTVVDINNDWKRIFAFE